MSSFLRNAEEIFATANQGGGEECELAITIGPEGEIQIICDSDWNLEALRAHHGAREVFRVTRNSRRVRLEARSGAQHCVLEDETPRLRMRETSIDFRCYAPAGAGCETALLASI